MGLRGPWGDGPNGKPFRVDAISIAKGFASEGLGSSDPRDRHLVEARKARLES